MVDISSILNFLAEKEPNLLKRAEELGIDAKSVIRERLETLKKKYSTRTIVSLAAAAIRREIERKSAKSVKGLLVGMYDVYGFRAPVRFILARKNGEHIVFSNFGTHLRDGTEITAPSFAEVSLNSDDYGYRIVEGVFTPVEPAKIVEKLREVAISPVDITEEHENRAVVVAGRIARVLPRTMFDSGEPVGHYPVMTKDEREDWHPTMEILLEREEYKRIRVILERQRYGRPVYCIEDFLELCEDALSVEDPTEQAQFLQDALQGRDIIVCGIVRSYNKTRTSSGEDIDYIDIIAGGIYELASESESEVEEVEEVEYDFSSEQEQEPEPEPEDFVSEAMMSLALNGGEWELQDAIELNSTNLKELPVVSVKQDSKQFGNQHIFVAEFSDKNVAGITIDGEGVVKAACTCGRALPCAHVRHVWAAAAKKHWMDMQKIAPQKPKEHFREEDNSEVEKLKKLIRAYCRALNLTLDDISEGTVQEKMGYRKSIAVVREALRQLREEGL